MCSNIEQDGNFRIYYFRAISLNKTGCGQYLTAPNFNLSKIKCGKNVWEPFRKSKFLKKCSIHRISECLM